LTTSVRAEPLRPTRVRRFYRGGALLGRLRGVPEDDDYLPESWIGSTTQARNVGSSDEEGLSRLADGRLLRDAVTADPIAWLGEPHVARFGSSTALLVKLLDAAERLPAHAHPDRAFAGRELGSPFGKTEAWVVLDTREDDARVWVGLREPVERQQYLAWTARQDVEALLGSLNELRVRPGDVVHVPGRVPHAIGAGVLIAELQEPTDLSLLCEWQGFPVREEDSHLGLGWERAVHALDLRAFEPRLGLPPEARAFFWADRERRAASRFTILLVLAGEGGIAGTPARAGDAFAVPAAVDDLELEGELNVLRCLAPDPHL
jgi:mannose-6-phosphate isomerase